MNNVIDDFHWQTANYLTKNYKNVLLPIFESQDLKKKSTNSRLNRDLDINKHYKFKQKLYFKASLSGTKVYDVNESFTTMTCTNCGILNNVGAREEYKCERCGLVIGRDHNGSRNVLLKHIV